MGCLVAGHLLLPIKFILYLYANMNRLFRALFMILRLDFLGAQLNEAVFYLFQIDA